jgi:CheY-like chemotaxis protein
VPRVTTDTANERPLRVLVADDHPTNRAVLEVILSLIEAELVSVEDGAQALAAFKSGEFDVVLMDLQMPVMDGFEAIREIRKFEAEMSRRRTPILAVSANAMSEHIAASRAAGADQHVAKPVVPDALLQAMADKIDEAAALPAPAPQAQAVG